MRRLAILTLAVAMAAASAGCTATPGGRQKETVGTLAGAGLGALAGSQIGKGKGTMVAIAVGTLVGAFLGNQVGASLDKADQLAIQQTTQQTLETAQTGQTLPWRNEQSGNYGTVTAGDWEYSDKTQGSYCREYTQEVIIAGEKQQAYGKACRQPDGTWKTVQ